MDPGPIFYILLQTPAAIICLLFPASTTVFHTVLLILCFCKTGGIDNLSVSSWAKFWFVLCRFHVVEGTTVNWEPAILLAPGEESSPTTFRRSPSPTGSITLGRNSRENLLLSSSRLPLGVSQHVLHHHLGRIRALMADPLVILRRGMATWC